MSDSAYDIIGDMAHEAPEIGEAVLRWKRERALGRPCAPPSPGTVRRRSTPPGNPCSPGTG